MVVIVKILKHWPNLDGWNTGDIVDITNPDKLIEEGKVEPYVAPKPKKKTTSKKAKK